MSFQLTSPFQPTGDQPQAITRLVDGLKSNLPHQVLLGVTGSGKTYTIANVINQIRKPTLVISHNKTLAGQLYQEFRDFFPQNGVSYFVSYYDYYQPEAYIPTTDTYIEKETDINEEIDKLRLQATTNLLTRKDIIVVASVSCIYNLGSPKEYGNFIAHLKVGQVYPRQELLLDLTRLQYERSDYDLKRGSFRVRGDTIEVWPAYTNDILRLYLAGDRIEKLVWHDPVSGRPTSQEILDEYVIYPAKHYLMDPQVMTQSFGQIRQDLALQLKRLTAQGKELEAHRLAQRVTYDLEMIQELGFVNGIENYSRYFDGRKPGEPPYTLLDYFEAAAGKDWLLVIDESHMTLPQIRGMYRGDLARKQTLVDYGFRLPSALDNRPLRFDEFLRRIHRTIHVSATPGPWETTQDQVQIVEQLIRPTGLVDPQVEIRPTANQVDDLAEEIVKRKQKGQRTLVTTLTKRLAEALTEYLNSADNFEHLKAVFPDLALPKVAYLHADIATLDRQDILDELRSGEYDVLVGINLLREGLDLPEVSLVAILDADKEGFLRSQTSLVQTMGRAARHLEGNVIMYADTVTGSMRAAIDEVDRRRAIQLAYNQKHGIVPKTVQKAIRQKLIERIKEKEGKLTQTLVKLTPKGKSVAIADLNPDDYPPEDKEQLIKRLRRAMFQAARNLEFEAAAKIRDKIGQLQR
jgi:excinuclease ABC subunit B